MASCVTPVIPLPPPEPADLKIVDKEKGLVEISGKAGDQYAQAYIFVLNVTGGHGVIIRAGANGSYTTGDFKAADGDYIDIWAKRSTYDDIVDVGAYQVDYSKSKLVDRNL